MDKHDRDPEEILEFYPTHAEAILWAASEKYAELANEDFLELGAFRGWIIVGNPDIVLEPYRQQLSLAELSTQFTRDMRAQYFEKVTIAYARTHQKAFRYP